MQYHLSDEQAQMRDAIAAFLADRYDHHARAAILNRPDCWSPGIWAALASELGALGLLVPEETGGAGGGPVDALLVMDAFGEALVVEPFLETCVIGTALLRRSGGIAARDLLSGVVSGAVRLALSLEEEGARYAPLHAATTATRSGDGFTIDGRKTMVVGAPAATHLLVTTSVAGEDGLAVFAVSSDHPSVELRKGRTLDGKGVAEIVFSSCAVPGEARLIPPAEGRQAVAESIDIGIAALCAEATGITRRLVRDTLDYLEQRHQFGSALIDFQVLQHRLADMHVRYEQVQAMAFFAAGMLSETSERRSVGISAAKVFVASAVRDVARDAVQLHGAMGITDELPIGHLFRRATALENEFGSIDHHLGRTAALGLPEQPLI